MSDTTYQENIEIGELGSAVDVTSAKLEVERKNTDEFVYFKTAADGMAATATAETLAVRIPLPRGKTAGDTYGIVKAIDWVGDADITGDPADYATFTFKKYNQSAGGAATVGTLTTIAGMTKWVRRAATLTGANTVVVCGGVITLTIAKAGMGQIVPVGGVYVRIFRQ